MQHRDFEYYGLLLLRSGLSLRPRQLLYCLMCNLSQRSCGFLTNSKWNISHDHCSSNQNFALVYVVLRETFVTLIELSINCGFGDTVTPLAIKLHHCLKFKLYSDELDKSCNFNHTSMPEMCHCFNLHLSLPNNWLISMCFIPITRSKEGCMKAVQLCALLDMACLTQFIGCFGSIHH